MAIVKAKGNSDCLTAVERAICAAWDNHQSIERIARRMKLSRDYVCDTISRLNDVGETRRTRAAMRQGSTALLAAMQREQAERMVAA